MPLQWLPVTAGYTRFCEATGFAGGYLLKIYYLNNTIDRILRRSPQFNFIRTQLHRLE